MWCINNAEALQSVKARNAAEEKSFDANLATATALGDAAAIRCELETAIDKYASEVSQWYLLPCRLLLSNVAL